MNNGSGFFRLGLADLAHGLVVAVLGAVLTAAQQAYDKSVDPTSWDWRTIGGIALGAALAYLAKSLLSTEDGKVLGKLGAWALVAVACLALAACTGAPVGTSGSTALSPREQDQQTLLAYAAMQQLVLSALQTPQVQADPALKARIKAGEQSARAALLDYDDQARRCVRDPVTGEIGDAPGATCNTSDVVRALQAASLAIAQAQTFATLYAPPVKPAAPAVSTPAS